MADRIDEALRDLASEVVFPPTPDLRRAVASRLHAPEPRSPRWAAWPRALALAAIVSLLLVAAAAAVALVLPGLRLTFVPTVPTAEVPEGPLATRLALGQSIPPETVGAGVPASVGAPDEAYILGDHEVLSLVYAAGDGLPELGGSGIGLLVQVIDGELDRARVEKLVDEVGASVTAIAVSGEAGYWIEGPPHIVRYSSPSGTGRSQATRLAGDTLVWEREGVLYRIESGLGRAETLRIAESIGE